MSCCGLLSKHGGTQLLFFQTYLLNLQMLQSIYLWMGLSLTEGLLF